ncbi:heme exporter protein A [Sphingomonas gellani]|uniref:Heme exporter protein A n=1 Tax=Sphingomonas gellani TaxID=1166340 RepID=A0A1H8GIF9_9SPHN|nr:heme ABC exporter ATP-binding protein CcmA [Sphingomonas gellani]SEN43796.1 heme exporter protein A [Sphingomonas gellani]
MTLLVLDRVTVARGRRILVEGLSIALEPGDAALVTGPNGVGKSSLIRLCAGLLPPAVGTVEAAPCALADARLALDDELPLERALRFWSGKARTHESMAALRLDHLAAVPVRLLSTGQRQRANLARVVASDAPLWLLDEPANGLDADSTALLGELVAAHRAGGGAVVIATHIPVTLPNAVEVRL